MGLRSLSLIRQTAFPSPSMHLCAFFARATQNKHRGDLPGIGVGRIGSQQGRRRDAWMFHFENVGLFDFSTLDGFRESRALSKHTDHDLEKRLPAGTRPFGARCRQRKEKEVEKVCCLFAPTENAKAFFFLSLDERRGRASERAREQTKERKVKKNHSFSTLSKEKKLSPSLFRSHVLCFSRRAALGEKRGRAPEPSGRCFVIVWQEWERRERGKRTKRFLLGPFDSFKLIFLFFQFLIAGRL